MRMIPAVFLNLYNLGSPLEKKLFKISNLSLFKIQLHNFDEFGEKSVKLAHFAIFLGYEFHIESFSLALQKCPFSPSM
jgi:hypothetical protein